MRGIYTTMKEMGSDAFRQSMAIFPYPPIVAEIVVFGTCVIIIICGIFMYEGQGWARWVYLPVMLPWFLQRFIAVVAPPAPAAPAGPNGEPASLLDHAPVVAAPHHKDEFILACLVLLYLLSIWVLFSRRARRYFNPPLYVDE